MGSLLPLYSRQDAQDVPYDNAKVRRRSAIKVALQAGVTQSSKWNCAPSIGKFLGIVLFVGLAYLSLMKSPQTDRIARLNAKRLAAGLKKTLLPNSSLGSDTYTNARTLWNRTQANQAHPLNTLDDLWKIRQDTVVGAFKHAWKGYKDFAMGFDELRPLSRRGVDGLGGLGATVVDSLDTALIMGCDDIVLEAGSWIERELLARFREKGQVNLFETTIRVLGGLLSAYHLSGGGTSDAKHLTVGPKPEVYLERAVDLADRLITAFYQSPTAVPFSDVILNERRAQPSGDAGGASSTAEATSVQMEFSFLSQVSGDPKYGVAAMRIYNHFKGLHKEEGLVPIYVSPHSGQFQGNNIRLGSRGDSYYEYLLKVWLQHGGTGSNSSHVAYLREMYDEAMRGVKHRLVGKSKPNGLVYIGELPNGLHGSLSPKMDHLVCFLAGTLALGATRGLRKDEAVSRSFWDDDAAQDLKLAEDLCHTCYQMYTVTATGLAPEIAYFNTDNSPRDRQEDGGKEGAEFGEDIIIKALDRHNLLRPETVESMFVLYRITGNTMYREWGWNIFQAFEAHTKVESGGYTSLSSVTFVPAQRRDKMETFFLGETLKYLYLLFGDASVLPLDRYVFNTEAHPMPIGSQRVGGKLSAAS